MYLLLLAVIYLAFVSLGLPDSLLGAAWPTIHSEINIPISYMGILSMIISGMAIITSIEAEKLTKKFSTRVVTAFSILLTAVGMWGFSCSKSFLEMIFWTIPYGIGGGAIDAALNNYVALHYKSKHINWLHCFWGVGTIVSPYIMSYAVKQYHWSVGYKLVAIIQLFIFAIFMLSFPLWKVNESKEENEESSPLKIREVINIKGVKYILIAFFCYCAAEATNMLWASSFLEVERAASKELAAAYGSLFFIGITLGRFISGLLSEKLSDTELVKLGNILAIIACFIIIVPNQIISVIGFVLIGLGCSPIYPCIIHSTPVIFGKEKSQAIIGVQMACAYIGSTFMPPVFGLIANHISMKLMPFFVLFFLLILLFTYNKALKLIESTSDSI